MIGLEDRQSLARDIDTALHAGARLRLACATAGIHVRTLQRWKTEEGLTRGDRRPDAVRPRPAHALTAEERTQVLEVANEARFADLPPARIVPMLADDGVYLASESTFSRVLRDEEMIARLRTRAHEHRAAAAPVRRAWCGLGGASATALGRRRARCSRPRASTSPAGR